MFKSFLSLQYSTHSIKLSFYFWHSNRRSVVCKFSFKIILVQAFSDFIYSLVQVVLHFPISELLFIYYCNTNARRKRLSTQQNLILCSTCCAWLATCADPEFFFRGWGGGRGPRDISIAEVRGPRPIFAL